MGQSDGELGRKWISGQITVSHVRQHLLLKLTACDCILETCWVNYGLCYQQLSTMFLTVSMFPA